jgi:kynurenine formamidase
MANGREGNMKPEEKGVQECVDFFAQYRFVDLSHRLEEHMPSYPAHSKYYHNLWESYWHGDIAVAYQITMNEHSGTHVDAPAHFIREESHPAHKWMDAIPVDYLFGCCVTLNLMATLLKTAVGAERVMAWEEEAQVRIQKDDVVLFNFGWHKRWKLRPEAEPFLSNWPGLSKDCAEYLAEREIRAVGTDAIALDVYGDLGFPAHYVLLPKEILIMENLNNLESLPPISYFMALPLNIKDGSGSPIRAVALVHR